MYIICDFVYCYITEMAVKTNTIVKSCLQHGHANRTTMAKRLLLLLLSFTKAMTASMNAPVIFPLAFFLLFKKNRSREKMRPLSGEKYQYASIASSRNAIIDMPLSDIDILVKLQITDSVSGFPQQQQTAPINSALEGYNNTAPIPYGDY